MSELTKIYVTKYALSGGIFEVDAKVYDDGSGMASFKRERSTYTEYVHGKDFYLTKAEAVARAEEMRMAKLKSLEKSAKKISALKFE